MGTKQEETEDNQIDTAEAADILGVTRRTIQRWLHDGYLKGRKFGNTYIIKRADAVELKEEHAQLENRS